LKTVFSLNYLLKGYVKRIAKAYARLVGKI